MAGLQIGLDVIARQLDEAEPELRKTDADLGAGAVTVVESLTYWRLPPTTNSSGRTCPVADETKPIMRWPSRSARLRGVPCVRR